MRVIRVLDAARIIRGHSWRQRAARFGGATGQKTHDAVAVDGVVHRATHAHIGERLHFDIQCDVAHVHHRRVQHELFPFRVAFQSQKLRRGNVGKRQQIGAALLEHHGLQRGRNTDLNIDLLRARQVAAEIMRIFLQLQPAIVLPIAQ